MRPTSAEFDTSWKWIRKKWIRFSGLSPHFSQAFYCGGGSGHVYSVALGRAPRRTVEYVCGALGRAPCIHARLRRLATKPCEKCRLTISSLPAVWRHGIRGSIAPVKLAGSIGTEPPCNTAASC